MQTGKILRIQSHAQVIFSDPLLIRYGTGVASQQYGGDSTSSDEEAVRVHCPILEFRIVNKLFNEVGGEIMDASLNVVANLNANDADPSLLSALDQSAGSYGRSNRTNGTNTGESIEDDSFFDGRTQRDTTVSSSSSFTSFSKFLHAMSSRTSNQQTFDEDPTFRVVPNKHIFSKLLIEASEHPFFKRCWVATHILDEHSPILKPRIRKLIRRHGGYWPEKLNNYSSIRESLQFNQILVSLNGVSNISASDVYAQKI